MFVNWFCLLHARLKQIYFTGVKKRIIRFLKNKYILATCLFVAWVTLFNDIDLLYIVECRMEVASLKNEVRELEDKNEKTKLILSDLTTNKHSMERFARETYFMKKDNEVVYVFKERADWIMSRKASV